MSQSEGQNKTIYLPGAEREYLDQFENRSEAVQTLIQAAMAGEVDVDAEYNTDDDAVQSIPSEPDTPAYTVVDSPLEARVVANRLRVAADRFDGIHDGVATETRELADRFDRIAQPYFDDDGGDAA